MSEQTDDPNEAVTRLEGALERIAQLAGQSAAAAEHHGEPTGPALPADEIASRLDELIDRLRMALNARPR